jgi:hypothetical protein
VVTEQVAQPSSPFSQHQQLIASLLRDPGAVGVGGHPGKVNSAGVQFYEEQHIQPPEPDRLDGEEVARHDPGGLLAQKRSPGAACPPGYRLEPVTAKRRTDRGRRHAHAKPLEFSLDALVTPPGILPGQPNDQLLDLLVQRWPANLAARVGPRAGDQPRCQPSNVSGFTKKHDQRDRVAGG